MHMSKHVRIYSRSDLQTWVVLLMLMIMQSSYIIRDVNFVVVFVVVNADSVVSVDAVFVLLSMIM